MPERNRLPLSELARQLRSLLGALLLMLIIYPVCWYFYPYVVGPFVIKMPGAYDFYMGADMWCELNKRPTTTDAQELASDFSMWICKRITRRYYVGELISKSGKRD
jgi:hypothetical protein